MYVATPAVLQYLGIDPGTVAPSTDYLVDRRVQPGTLVIPSMTKRREYAVTNVQRIETGGHLFGAGSGVKPPYFITLNGLRRHGWKQIRAGWLVESGKALTSGQIANARDVAAAAGLTIEVRRQSNPPTKAMAIATAAGALLALAVLAMTTGLIRGESAGDLRTLTAAGNLRIRRTLTATTAGALAFLGALLGIARRLRRSGGDVSRRHRLPEQRAGPLPRPRSRRRATRRRRSRLAPRGPRASRHREDGHRVTGVAVSSPQRPPERQKTHQIPTVSTPD